MGFGNKRGTRATRAILKPTENWPAPITDLEPDLPRAGKAKPKKARKTVKKRVPKLRPLTARQMQIRDLIIEHRNTLTEQQIADIVGCWRSAVYADKAAIRRHAPMNEEQFLPDHEIFETIAFHDELEDRLQGELVVNEAEIAAVTVQGVKIGLYNVRLGLLNQLASCREKRTRFMMDIGLLREAPKRMMIEERTVAEISGEDVYHEIEATDLRIEALRRGIPQSTRTGAAGAAAEELPAPPEGEDQLQGTGPDPAG